MENSKLIATAILNQLGGRRFIAMTGAKTFLYKKNGISFRLPNNFAKDKINAVTITLNSDDLYDMEFSYIRGTSIKNLARLSGVFAEDLQPLFTDTTGLYTRI